MFYSSNKKIKNKKKKRRNKTPTNKNKNVTQEASDSIHVNIVKQNVTKTEMNIVLNLIKYVIPAVCFMLTYFCWLSSNETLSEKLLWAVNSCSHHARDGNGVTFENSGLPSLCFGFSASIDL